MFKSLSRPVPAGLVLITGLVSCSPVEKHTKDVYVARPPRVQRADGSLDLRTWDSLQSKALDLQDELDVSEAAPASSRVRTSCRRDGRYFTAVNSFAGRQRLPVWLLLPPAVLTQKIKAVECGFELNLYNSSG